VFCQELDIGSTYSVVEVTSPIPVSPLPPVSFQMMRPNQQVPDRQYDRPAGHSLRRDSCLEGLAVLEAAGLLERRKLGREVAFAVRPDRLDVAARLMAQVATEWDARLTQIKRLAEATAEEQRRQRRTDPA
jgi:hypothetical protein